ncbi:MAG: hypothetical protein HY741_00950 [Chloroflexi bacterium]|nr:hypothetical protein [Chloroflexota bacterium]
MGEAVILNLPEVVAARARQVASQTHRRVEDVLIEWLYQDALEPGAQALPHTEAELLQNINLGLSEVQWQRYHALVAKRRAETLTPQERHELVAMSDQIEQANAQRIESLVELAKLRQTSLDNLMHDLGITAPAYV